MSIIVRAHFDGNAIVPDTAVDLPEDQPLEVEIRVLSLVGQASKAAGSGAFDIASLPFFGMWADREDMRDSAQWVRKEREKWSNRLSGTD